MTGFQRTAFQDNAFQIAAVAVPASGAGRRRSIRFGPTADTPPARVGRGGVAFGFILAASGSVNDDELVLLLVA